MRVCWRGGITVIDVCMNNTGECACPCARAARESGGTGVCVCGLWLCVTIHDSILALVIS